MTPMSRALPQYQGASSGHAWKNIPLVGTGRIGGEWKMTLAQVKIHPPTPPSSPLSRGEGLGMASTGVTGRYQTLGFWGDGAAGVASTAFEPAPTSNRPDVRAGIAPHIAAGLKEGFWAHPPSLPSHPLNHTLYRPRADRVMEEGRVGLEGWGGESALATGM